MTGFQPPDPVRKIADLEHAVAVLQRLVRTNASHTHNVRDLNDADMSKVLDGQGWIYQASTGTMVPRGALESPPFSLATLAVSISGRWYPPVPSRVVRLVASLRTVGSTATTLYILKNGTRITGLTIGASAYSASVATSISFTGPESDYMQVEVSAAGAGAANLTVQPRLG